MTDFPSLIAGSQILDTSPEGLFEYVSVCMDQLIERPSSEASDALAKSLDQLSAQSPLVRAQILDIINQKWTDTAPDVTELIRIILRKLIDQGTLSLEFAVELLDKNILQEANLISNSQILSTRSVRINTGLLYKQQKFNLLREDNEGYAKLSHEMNLAFSELPKGGILDVDEMRTRCEDLLTVVNALIGYFELDPNRVLDNVLDVCSQNLLSHSKFILNFLHHSPWAPTQMATSPPFSTLSRTEKRKRLDGLRSDFPGFYESEIQKPGGSKLAAQLLGFKLRSFVSSDGVDEKTIASPESLLFMIALLLKSGFLHFSDIYPYVEPFKCRLILSGQS